MPKTHKFAKDLTPGDRAQVCYRNTGMSIFATVVGVTASVQTIRRPVVLVTFRSDDGTEVHRTYMERTAVNLVSEVK